MKERSNGSTAGYYQLPAGATQLQDLISQRNMNAQIGEIFRACYRYGLVEHSDMLRDARKILFYAKAEVDRLEKLRAESQVGDAEEPCEPAPPADYPKLAVGQVWKDCLGREVTIVSSDDYDYWPFNGSNGESFTPNGYARSEDEGRPNDLVELIQDEHGWRPWKATKDSVCPVDPRSRVMVRLEKGTEMLVEPAHYATWNEKSAIVAYKVVQ